MQISATKARSDLYGLIADVNDRHEVVTITSRKGDAVLIAADDWRGIEETLHLLSTPNNARRLRDSIAAAERGEHAERAWPDAT